MFETKSLSFENRHKQYVLGVIPWRSWLTHEDENAFCPHRARVRFPAPSSFSIFFFFSSLPTSSSPLARAGRAFATRARGARRPDGTTRGRGSSVEIRRRRVAVRRTPASVDAYSTAQKNRNARTAGPVTGSFDRGRSSRERSVDRSVHEYVNGTGYTRSAGWLPHTEEEEDGEATKKGREATAVWASGGKSQGRRRTDGGKMENGDGGGKRTNNYAKKEGEVRNNIAELPPRCLIYCQQRNGVHWTSAITTSSRALGTNVIVRRQDGPRRKADHRPETRNCSKYGRRDQKPEATATPYPEHRKKGKCQKQNKKMYIM